MDIENLFNERRKYISSLNNFWSHVFYNHLLLRQCFNEILNYIIDLNVNNDKKIIIKLKKNNFIKELEIIKYYNEKCKIHHRVKNSLFITWINDTSNYSIITDIILFDIWINPIQYYLVQDLDIDIDKVKKSKDIHIKLSLI